MNSIYRSGTKLDVKEYNILLNWAGLGDIISHMPPIKYILDHHPQIVTNVWVHDYVVPLYQKVFKDYRNCIIHPFSKREEAEKLPTRSPCIHRLTSLSCHLVDHGFYSICYTSVEDKYKDYIQLDPIDVSYLNLPEKYIVVTTGYTSESRRWKPKYINSVVEYIIANGYAPVFIGKSTNGIADYPEGHFDAGYSKGISFIDKTDLFEAHAIMNNATAVLGIDNGLMHLNSMGKAPSVWGFTTVKPEHRLPYKDGILGKDCLVVVPPETLKCRFCQSNMVFADNGHDFKTCFYQDYACTDMMTADKWIEQLEKIILTK